MMSSVPIHNDHKELEEKEFLQLKEQCLEGMSVRFAHLREVKIEVKRQGER
jgi:hypothetical protein